MTKSKTITLRKYLAIQKRFKELYDGNRMRYDDVMKKLSDEFFIGEFRLNYVLKLDLEKMERKIANNNQLNLFEKK